MRLAILSLAVSGLAPLLLIAGRASIYAELDLIKEWFVPVLVIHVNLSVGLWFLACFGVMQAITSTRHALSAVLHNASIISFALAIILFALAPIAGGDAYTSNYIPVQNNVLFFLGLGFVASSLIVTILNVLLQSQRQTLMAKLVTMMAIVLSISIACFVFSTFQHPSGYGGEAFYEAIFWGGGHVLQLLYVMLAMMAWLWIADNEGDVSLPAGFVSTVFMLLSVTALVSPLIYLFADVNSYEHIKFFTWQMNVITGPVPTLILLMIVAAMMKRLLSWGHPAMLALAMSFLLFSTGGLTGYLIEGSNVTIPAHYHGSTVGVTLALMGVFYILVPRITGYDFQQSRWAKWQPVLYGGGQLLHVIGLAWAGGHNIARKTAGALSADQLGAELALQVMRSGGLLAVIGGGIFVWLMIRALFRRVKATLSD